MPRRCRVLIEIAAACSCGIIFTPPAVAQHCPAPREAAEKFVGDYHEIEFKRSTRYETLTFVSEAGLPVEPRPDEIAAVRDAIQQAKLGEVLDSRSTREVGTILVRLAPGVTPEQVQHITKINVVAGGDRTRGIGNPVFDAGDVDRILVNRIIVQFHPKANKDAIDTILAGYCARLLDRGDSKVGSRYLLTFDGQTARHALAMVNRLNGEKLIEYAQPDMVVVAEDRLSGGSAAGPSNTCPPTTTSGVDPYFPQQWFLDHAPSSPGDPNADINALEAWTLAEGANILVAVLDGAVETSHEDLQGKIDGTWNSYTLSPDLGITDEDKHATPVAGIIGAMTGNTIGVKGTAPKVRLMAVRVVDWVASSMGGMTEFYTYSAVVNGIEHAVAANAHVISMSLSLGADDLDSCDRGGSPCQGAVRNAVTNAIASGTVPVFAAGNDGLATLAFPAALAGTMPVIAVGATDDSDTLVQLGVWGSNHGADLSVVAPGVSVVATDRMGAKGYCPGNYVGFAGTSAATPIVAGVAALMQSRYLAQGQTLLTPKQLKDRLQATAKDLGATGDDILYGNGRADACKALTDNGCSIPNPPSDLYVDNVGSWKPWVYLAGALILGGGLAWWVKTLASKRKPE